MTRTLITLTLACLVALALLVVAGLIARRSSPEFPG